MSKLLLLLLSLPKGGTGSVSDIASAASLLILKLGHAFSMLCIIVEGHPVQLFSAHCSSPSVT